MVVFLSKKRSHIIRGEFTKLLMVLRINRVDRYVPVNH